MADKKTPHKWGSNITDFTQDIENIPINREWSKSIPEDLRKLCSKVRAEHYPFKKGMSASERAQARLFHVGNAPTALLGRKKVSIDWTGYETPFYNSEGKTTGYSAGEFLDAFPEYKKLIDDPIVIEARASVKAYSDSLKSKRKESAKKAATTRKKNAAEASKSGCFIATAAYGTPFSEEIDVLRNWRDDFLEASYPGRLFIKTYYSLSPPVADNISESHGKRKVVRAALGPVVKILKDKYSN